MLNIQRILKEDRLCKAMMGVSRSEFEDLAQTCERVLTQSSIKKWRKRKKRSENTRKPGGGSKGKLTTVETKLFFILVYFKCYPTMDFMGIMFDINRSNVKRRRDHLEEVLEGILETKKALPRRKISSMEDFLEMILEAKDVFIDGTERPHHRPKDSKKQKNLYSSKKKKHTTKNIVLNDEKKNILYLSPTVEGKKHDLTIFKEDLTPEVIPKDITAWLDLGFLGIEKYFPDLCFEMPKRKPYKKEHTPEDKANNKVISSIRIISEHAIGGAKRFRITTDTFRNKSSDFNDKALFLACGLWNYHLSVS